MRGINSPLTRKVQLAFFCHEPPTSRQRAMWLIKCVRVPLCLRSTLITFSVLC
uniref:Uncharacterized protein n=1 Tax=Anguilla anguilla TaxID=7936 RepID=A0A0E9RH88_ANGAN